MRRYDLVNFKWSVIEPLLPNGPQCVPRADDQGVLDGIGRVPCAGAQWQKLLVRCGLCTIFDNRFIRWRTPSGFDWRASGRPRPLAWGISPLKIFVYCMQYLKAGSPVFAHTLDPRYPGARRSQLWTLCHRAHRSCGRPGVLVRTEKSPPA